MIAVSLIHRLRRSPIFRKLVWIVVSSCTNRNTSRSYCISSILNRGAVPSWAHPCAFNIDPSRFQWFHESLFHSFTPHLHTRFWERIRRSSSAQAVGGAVTLRSMLPVEVTV
jgi:hypothetical protein